MRSFTCGRPTARIGRGRASTGPSCGFGASRLARATDYTAARGRLGDAVTYPMLRDFVEIALPALSAAERDDVFGGTISRLLRW